MYINKLSGPFLTLVRGSRLTEERTASAQTWYVGITCVWPLLEIKSGGNCTCLSIVSRGYCVHKQAVWTLLDSCPGVSSNWGKEWFCSNSVCRYNLCLAITGN